jgi:group I intron endonuclease
MDSLLNDIKHWVIYKITSPTERVYIGKTSNWNNRYSNYKHFTVAKQVHKQRMLYASLLKYGFESHKLEKIDEFDSDANYCSGKEMFWIRSYMSNNCKYPEIGGMNLTNGGDGNLGWKRPKESIEEIRKKNTGKVRSKEIREKMSKSKIGNKNGCGKKLTEEHKRILSECNKNKKGDIKFKKTCKDRAARINNQNGKIIIHLDEHNNIINTFDFLYEAAYFFGVSESAMRDYINKKRVSKKISAILKYKKDL